MTSPAFVVEPSTVSARRKQHRKRYAAEVVERRHVPAVESYTEVQARYRRTVSGEKCSHELAAAHDRPGRHGSAHGFEARHEPARMPNREYGTPRDHPCETHDPVLGCEDLGARRPDVDASVPRRIRRCWGDERPCDRVRPRHGPGPYACGDGHTARVDERQRNGGQIHDARGSRCRRCRGRRRNGGRDGGRECEGECEGE